MDDPKVNKKDPGITPVYVILVYVLQTFKRRSMEKHTSQSYEEALLECGLIFHEFVKQDYIHLSFF